MSGAETSARRRKASWGSIRKIKGGWQARLPPAVDPDRRPLPDGPFPNWNAANRALTYARVQHEGGRLPLPPGRGAPHRTVDDEVSAYLDSLAPSLDAPNVVLEANTIRDYQYLRRKVIGNEEWGIGRLPLARLGRAQVRGWLTNAIANGSRTRARKALRLLNKVLAEAAAENPPRIVNNPAAGLDLPGTGSGQAAATKHFLATGQEIIELTLAATAVSERPLLVELLPWSGLRSQEVRGLRACDLNARLSHLSVVRAVGESYAIKIKGTKSSQTRHVAVPKGLMERLVRYVEREGLDDQDLLFPSRIPGAVAMRGTELHDHSWGPACAEAGLEGDPSSLSEGRREAPTPHDMRASHASLLVALGWLDLQTMQQMGHSTITVTKDVYAEVEHASVGVNPDARALSLDPDLAPGARLSLLYEAWWKRYGGRPAPNYDAWLQRSGVVTAEPEGILGARDMLWISTEAIGGDETAGQVA